MITAAEIARGIEGAWRLAWLDRRGLDVFDKSEYGFWRSFWAAAVVAPGYVLLGLIKLEAAPEAVGTLRFFSVEAIGYVIGWTAFPLALFYLTAMMDRGHRYLGYIVAYNWSHILQMAVFLPLAVLEPSEGVEAGSTWSLLMTVASLLIFFYVGYIAKVALDISALMAAGIVVLDLAISVMITAVKDSLIV